MRNGRIVWDAVAVACKALFGMLMFGFTLVHCSHCALEAKWQDPRIESGANGAQRQSALFWSKELVLNAPGHFQEFEAVLYKSVSTQPQEVLPV